MTLTAIMLLSISVSVHAIWNFLGKRENPTAAFMLIANTLGGLCLLPAIILYPNTLAAISERVWGYLALSGLCQSIYYVSLAGAYRSGELSIAYPLARSFPVLIVAAITAILGWGTPLSHQFVLGIILIVAGCLILPMRQFSNFNLQNYWNLTSLLALTAAFGTAGYSLIDSEALGLLRQATRSSVSGPAVTVVYSLLEGLVTSLWLVFFVLAEQSNRRAFFKIKRDGLYRAALVGAGIYLAYTLVLISMAFVTNVSYVVAFRQLSIPLGALLGVVVLKEPLSLPKCIGVAVTFVGLVLVSIN